MSTPLPSSASPWTAPLYLVGQPFWTPDADSSLAHGECLTRIRLPQTHWTLSPLDWWKVASTVHPSVVARLDQWVWQTVTYNAPPETLWHINVWPQTVLQSAGWIAQQPIQPVALEITEQWAWDGPIWERLHAVWIQRGGAVWVDDWTDPTRLPPYAGLTGLKLDRRIWDLTAWGDRSYAQRWTQFVTRCHDQGLLVIAEGIETADQRDVAIACGCDGCQGFLWGTPQPWPFASANQDATPTSNALNS